MTSFIRKEEYDVIELDGEWIILNSDDFMVTSLNEVGGFCWSLLHAECTTQQIIQTIKTHYETEEASIEQDIEVFLANLMDCGLIRHAS
jgi:hypothetical protein